MLKARFVGPPPFPNTKPVVMMLSYVFTEDTVLQACVAIGGPRVPIVSSVFAFNVCLLLLERNLN